MENKLSDKKEEFMPPDHGDVCWHIGSETFTRKEVYHLLWTQRAMISNDIKRGVALTPELIEIIENPRIPEF